MAERLLPRRLRSSRCSPPLRWHLTHSWYNEPGGGWDIKGDPTEGALVVAAAKAGMDKADLDTQFPRMS